MIPILKRAAALLLTALQALLLMGKVVPVTGAIDEHIITADSVQENRALPQETFCESG